MVQTDQNSNASEICISLLSASLKMIGSIASEKKCIHIFFRRSRAANSVVCSWMWPKIKLIQACMHALVSERMKMILSKMKGLEWSQHCSHYKSMGIFSNAQGQLTPHLECGSGRISNSSEIFWLSSLPARMKVQSKMRPLEC